MVDKKQNDLMFALSLLGNEEKREKAKQSIHKISSYARNNLPNIIKEYKIWYLIIILAFCCGWLLSAMYYANKCNEILSDRNCLLLTDSMGNVIGYTNLSYIDEYNKIHTEKFLNLTSLSIETR